MTEIEMSVGDVLQEVNDLSLSCAEKVQNLPDLDKKRKTVAMTIALGVLWFKWLEETQEEARHKYINLAATIATRITGIPQN